MCSDVEYTSYVMLGHSYWDCCIIVVHTLYIMQGLLGTILCEGQKNEGVIPINKNLWYVDQSYLVYLFWHLYGKSLIFRICTELNTIWNFA